MKKKGRPRKGEIRQDLLDLSPEEQMKRDEEIKKLCPDDGNEPFTFDLLHRISKLPEAKKRSVVRALGEVEWERCSKDIFYWMDNRYHPIPYVYTLDPRTMYYCQRCADQDPSTKDVTWGRFQAKVHLMESHDINTNGMEFSEILEGFVQIPTTRPWTMKDYFRPVIQAWLEHPIVVIEKSRDMMATWLFTTCYTWDTLYHEGQQNVFQSDDTEKTRELVEKRSMFIFEHQPKFLQDIHPAKFEVGISKGGRFYVPDLNSEIIGLAQGPDQIRYLHPAGVLIDEAAFHNRLAATVGAVKPAIEKGGRITLVSSANPGYFQALAQDFSER